MSIPADFDAAVRTAAMQFLADNQTHFPYGFKRDFLLKGFEFQGKKVSLVSAAQGIHKPAILDLPLSIFTTYTPPGEDRPYADDFDKNEFLLYKYRGTDPMHPNNVGLRKLMLGKLPLIYFQALKPSLYEAFWPSRIVGDDRASLTFRIEIIDAEVVKEATAGAPDTDEFIRRYARLLTKRRLHQTTFRVHVLQAYRERCTICRFAHSDMLDAAHIIPDSDPRGAATVSNGLSLCKLHHSAYDRNLLGISPDYKIKIRRDVMDEEDGPTLKHGLQEFDGSTLAILPHQSSLRPNRDHLEFRFERFLKA